MLSSLQASIRDFPFGSIVHQSSVRRTVLVRCGTLFGAEHVLPLASFGMGCCWSTRFASRSVTTEMKARKEPTHSLEGPKGETSSMVESAEQQRLPVATKRPTTTSDGLSSSVAPAAAAASRRPSRRCSMTSSSSPPPSPSPSNGFVVMPAWKITALIVLLGFFTSNAFLYLGVRTAYKEQEDQFVRSADETIRRVQRAWYDYIHAASMIHARCRSRNFTRDEFRQLYEYLIDSGLRFQAAQFDPLIARHERDSYEAEARAFYAANYPHVQYRGIVSVDHDNTSVTKSRDESEFYVPVHYMEPIVGNEAAIGLDYHVAGSRIRTVEECLKTGKPALTDRLKLVREAEEAYGLILMHPGVNLTTQSDVWPRDLSSIVIRIPDLLNRSMENQGESTAAFLFDPSVMAPSGEPLFLGGVRVDQNQNDDHKLTFLPDTELSQLVQRHHYCKMGNVTAANKVWKVVVVAVEGRFQPQLLFVCLGSAVIFVASVCLAYWNYSNAERVRKFNAVQAQAEAEKQALILASARQAAEAERELNDFIAHEVRNPVAAAMSACSFVKSAVRETNPMVTDKSIQSLREDVDVIDNALHFVNELLRSMLDMHRAANRDLRVHMERTDLLRDVLEPVAATLHHRRRKVHITVECPENLYTLTDRLRLKQIVLNLSRNSCKFVEQGYIRLRAYVVDGLVELAVEDSGPGIPADKRTRLFSKFQESLDTLSQGTGIGLFLCKNLTELLGGEIRLDTEYDSGVPDHPGTRFVIKLNQNSLDPLLEFPDDSESSENKDAAHGGSGSLTASETDDDDDRSLSHHELPSALRILFVDDDAVLRKLFLRQVKLLAPAWTVREASNGETALLLVEEHEFDLIFMDQYMASVDKQLLGTETVQALRANGITCRICGLSANDKEDEFLEAGADVFTMKPFPCETHAMTKELCRVLFA